MALNLGPDKQTGQQHTAQEYNAFKAAILGLDESMQLFILELLKKASLLNGKIPLTELPDVVIVGMTGSGTAEDPYIIPEQGSGGQVSAEAYLKALPGYVEGEQKILYSAPFSWGPIPAGDQDELAKPTLTMGAATVNGVPMNWTQVVDATSYTVQRALSDVFADAVVIYSGNGKSFVDIGLTAKTKYNYRVRATATGFKSSQWDSKTITTPEQGNITPPAPTLPITNDSADTFDFTFATGYAAVADYEFTLDGGSAYVQLTAKPLVIGDVSKPVGQVGVRVKAATGRDYSATLFNTVAFLPVPITPPAPTAGIVNNDNDTFDFTFALGYNNIGDYEYSLNGGATILPLSVKPIIVGDLALAAGQVRVRVKAAIGRNASAWLMNLTAFTIAPPATVPLTKWVSVLNGTLTDNNISFTSSPGYGQGLSKYYIPAGGVGFVQFTADVALNGAIVLDSGNTQPNNQALIRMDYSNERFKVFLGPDDQFVNPRPAAGPNLRGRLRCDGVSLYAECSTDAGSTWVIMKQMDQPIMDLYVKAFVDVNTTAPVKNIRGMNLTETA